ncbi:hypothetical protein LMH73_014720 [Vibrio splendidus]|nr:hypothetical protein [Vibrio splendidus]MCC4882927.1 hypothetical protein [Vibrio splendidus]
MLITEVKLKELSNAVYDAALDDVQNLIGVDRRSICNLRNKARESSVEKSMKGIVDNAAVVTCGKDKMNIVSRAFWNTDIKEVNKIQAKLDMVLASLTKDQASLLDEVMSWVVDEAKCEKDYDDNYSASR